MAVGCYSESEKIFILHGVEDNFRYDGRTRSEYRPIEVETDVVSHANGSARLRLANTDILVGVKAEIVKPTIENPDKGKIEFFVDCSANATPAFEKRGGEDLANDLSSALTRAYSAPESLDLKSLCILPKFQCWKLYVDVLILECGGNLFDAVGLGVKAALRNTFIPRVVAAALDGCDPELVISEDPYDCWRLDTSKTPVFVTVMRIGDHCVVDPGAEEEAVSGGGLLVSYGSGSITSLLKISGGSLHPITLREMIQLGGSAGECLQDTLERALKEEDSLGPKREKAGFLK
ncbi:Exosome complex exonuclease RRP42, putative [Pediculus humanus corporis]|uniref:Ribosomal RNA-processing protein 42 n=1 Tax=Pediculus humanus subsp. corporis TaxID=121224 RepID=E0VZC4_PEDHC|nr:Exosome complex exonuclease RRP42, putative [Pediculus humanus corporis]EEB18730.1 Exosome complex exonuclease RRP42, putative [Pediculus humanus corporis]